MSRNDQNEWTDSLDFESLADEQEIQEPAAAAAAPPPPEAAAPAAAKAAGPTRAATRPPRRPRVSGKGLGFLFAASCLVAAFGLAAAVVTALGVDPAGLWQPAGLLQYRQIVDFQTHPLNLLYIVGLATVLLALLGAGAVSRAVGTVGRAAERDAQLVDKLTALRIDDDKGWQDPLFKQHPTAAAFVNENVGAWRLGEARQRRAAGLEGELQRLVRAAGANDRGALGDRFDNPNVGSLADELVRFSDEREAAVQEAAAIRAKDREESEHLLGLITEACGWTNAAMDKVGVQGAAVERVAAAVRRLADAAGARGGDDAVARSAAAVASLRSNLSSLKPTSPGAGSADIEHLADRSNKLAFQIAMEVARLGQRGDRLLPMTQALEELATEFRGAAEGLSTPAIPDDAFAAAEHTLDQVQHALEQAVAAAEQWRRTAQETAPVAAEAAAQLTGLSGGFNSQAERLNNAGEACARMTGLSFDPQAVQAVDPVEAPLPDLGITRFDPFAAKMGAPELVDISPDLDVDPFATGEAGPAAMDLTFGDPDPFLAADPEPVYDLNGFGAVTLGDPVPAAEPAPEPVAPFGAFPAAEADESDVMDLASFGAVRLDHDEPALALQPVGGDEEIHDLAEFGAVPLD